MKNRYPGTCVVCRAAVPVDAGDYNPTTRQVKCAPCSGVVQDALPRVKATKQGSQIFFAPTGFLGSDLFSKYREACRGSKFDPTTKSQVCSLDRALAIVKALSDAAFIVDISPDITAALQATTAQTQQNVEKAVVRADETDRKLRERGLTLFPFQRTGIQWLAGRSGSLLADEMGLGKTIQAIVALPENAPVIVVAPAIAKGVWAREIKKWRPEFKVTVLSGRKSWIWPERGEIVITNYDVLPEDPRVEHSKGQTCLTTTCAPNTVLISDESHNLKSSRARRTKLFRIISEVVRMNNGKVWLITATPLLNKPPELWCILQAADIAREAFGSWDNFVRVFNGHEGEYGGYVWGTPTPEAEQCLRRVQLRRMRMDVLPELPTKSWRSIEVDIDPKSAKAIDKATKATKFIQGLLPTAWDRLLSDEDLFDREPTQGDLIQPKDIEAAREVLSSTDGRSFDEMSHARTLLAQAKIPALIELVEEYEEQEEPVVVFSAHRAPIDLLAKRPGWAVITGDTKPEDRTKIEEAFQSGKLKGVAATIKAGGVAITLTRASHAIFIDLEFTPALNDQAEDRVCRIGQTRGVLITRLVAKHPLDKIMHRILHKKDVIIEASIDASRTKDDVVPFTLPTVDFAALEAAAEKERRAADEARRIAEERQAMADSMRSELEIELVKARAEKRTIRKDFMGPGRRGPQAPMESWAFEGLLTLAQHDPDMASQRNQVGFNGADGPSGHRLANRAHEGLTDAEWKLSVALCQKYWRQIGRMPT